jgi:hypothetical protein
MKNHRHHWFVSMSLVMVMALGIVVSTSAQAHAGPGHLLESSSLLEASALVPPMTKGLSLWSDLDNPEWDDDPVVDEEELERESAWYGDELLWWSGGSMVFGLLGAGIAGGADLEGIAAVFGAVTSLAYLFSGVYVHATHDEWGHAWGSLALRVGGPMASSLFGALIGLGLSGDAIVAGVGGMIGLGVGGIVSIILDAAYLAYHSDAERSEAMSLTPYFDVSDDHRAAGLILRF